jgi:dipeptidyl aminopeptidase/acylaminoacyl peptidase
MTEKKRVMQFGLWQSPISPASIARGTNFSDIAWELDGTLVWRESRDDRGVLVVQSPNGQSRRDLNSEYNVHAGVGYGGGDFSVGHGDVYFVEAKSGRIFRQHIREGLAEPITPAFGSAASPKVSPDGKSILYVHSYEGKDCIAVVDTEGANWPQKVVFGDDFYMQPEWHPNGKNIAWLSWNHPRMPWDGTTLNLAELTDQFELKESIQIAGGETIAVFGVQFSPDGRYLAYTSDQSGWWQLYIYNLETEEHSVLTGGEAEHGLPAWIQGMRTFDFAPDSKSLYFLQNRDGFMGLWQVDIKSKMQQRIRVGSQYTWMEQIAVARSGESVAVIASGGRTPTRIVRYDLSAGARVVAHSRPEELPQQIYSLPSPISWSSFDGEDVYGIFFAPNSVDFEGIGLPPLMVMIHGGPTSQSSASFDGKAQFFTSRGWAVLQVNYRGSSGYGRVYRDKLKGNWGIYDVQDAVSGAKSLVDEGQVNGDKLVIMGGSAGGFTVLKTLEDHPGFFKAGVCSYGVSNHFTLASDTHKFEERYLDSLLGPLPVASDIYRERSPIFFVEKIQDPIIIFQGEDDKVVPKEQSEQIVASLRRTGVPHEYHLYPGEGHGFRKTETIEAFYKALGKFLETYVLLS